MRQNRPKNGTKVQASQSVQFRVATILVQNRSLAFFRPLDRESHPRSLPHPGMRGDPRGRKDYHGELLFGKELWSSANRHLSAVNRERGYLVEIHRFRSPRSLCLLFLAASVATAQDTAGQVRGPVPPAILSARRIFVSNAGADSGLFPKPFSGNTDRAYNQFFAALKAAGLFELVSDPSEADLVLELQTSRSHRPVQCRQTERSLRTGSGVSPHRL